MKYLIMFLVLTGLTIAQTKGVIKDGGTIWTDSLGYGTVATSDSVWVLRANLEYKWYRVFIEGNANSPTDSFYVQAGSVRYDEAKADVDSTWGSWLPVQDSLFNSIHTMINNSVGKDFLIFAPMVQLLRFTLLNHRGGLITRNIVITIQAVKR